MDENFGSGTDSPGTDQVLSALERLLNSHDLRLSERNRRFLSFVVTQAIQGSADRIKAYTIGVDVFGRDEAFDPTTDPIVRIEATRLRAALASYYERAGMEASVRISLPKGSYVPAFSWAVSPAPAQPKAVAVGRLVTGHGEAPPRAAQVILHDHTRHGDQDVTARAELFLDTLAVMLRRAALTIRVVPPHERKAAADAIQAIYSMPHQAFSLDIAVRPVDEKLRYSWRLGDLETGEILLASFRDYAVASSSRYERIDDLAVEATSAISGVIGLGVRARTGSAS